MVYGILLADFRRNITVKFLFAYAAIAANPKYLSFLARTRAGIKLKNICQCQSCF